MSRSIEELPESPANGGFPRVELSEWAELGIVAGITVGGAQNDLGLWRSTAPEVTRTSLIGLLNSWGASFDSLVLAEQVHGCEVAWPTGAGTGIIDKDRRDGHLTRTRGLLLGVTVADCVPVYLADPRSGTMGLLHAGWKGLAAGILEEGVSAMLAGGVKSASDILMHCGVSICGNCYEVGGDVVSAVTGKPNAGKSRLDLRAELARRGQNLGISRVTLSTNCTYHDYPAFFSYRKSGGSSERMLAFLGVPNA